MAEWKVKLNGDATEWLLEEDNPSVRYFTLRELLEKPETDSEVLKAKAAIMTEGIVPKILSKQNSDGTWETPTAFYTAKYKGTSWQLIILAELGADTSDSRIKNACESLLQYSQHIESGGFSVYHLTKTDSGSGSYVIPCLTGNMVWSLIRLGYLSDKRVQAGIDWITKYQRFDDGDGKPKGWPYDRFTTCFGKHTCHMGAVKALKALAEIPAEERGKATQSTIDAGVEYLLKHHIFKSSHNLNKVSKPGWLKFAFPLMYQDDALEVLGILAKLGCKDSRMQEAVDLVLSKQDAEGRWKLENTFNGRYQVNIERKGEPSKWITLKALTALKRFYG